MTQIQKRNRTILEMRKAGGTRQAVARRFGISVSSVAMIERRNEQRTALIEKRMKLRWEFRQQDDPERLWPVEDFVDVLELLPVTRTWLLQHFHQQGKKEVCLREFIGLVVPAESDQYPQLWRVHGIGKYGYRSVVRGLVGLDMGPRCNEQWRWRLAGIQVG